MKLDLIFLIGCFLLSGCATLSEEECRIGNWYEIGRQDGIAGTSTNLLNLHREACMKYHITPDLHLYQRGREVGLLSYCTPERGLKEGLNGKSYHNVCPHHLETAFLKNYHRGYKIYDLKRTLDRIHSEVEQKENELETKDITPEKKEYLRRKISELKDEQNQLRITLTALEVVDFIKSY